MGERILYFLPRPLWPPARKSLWLGEERVGVRGKDVGWIKTGRSNPPNVEPTIMKQPMVRKQRTNKETKELFRDPSGQPHLFEKSYQEELEAKAKKEVECLGMTFENDEARRAYFLEKLKEKLKDPEFRKIEGFPISSGCLFCSTDEKKASISI